MADPVQTETETRQAEMPPVVVKKYANRRLYNTESSSYITLDNLAEMVRQGRDFVVYDAKTGDDITRSGGWRLSDACAPIRRPTHDPYPRRGTPLSAGTVPPIRA